MSRASLQRRRDEEARAAASQQLDVIGPALEALASGGMDGATEQPPGPDFDLGGLPELPPMQEPEISDPSSDATFRQFQTDPEGAMRTARRESFAPRGRAGEAEAARIAGLGSEPEQPPEGFTTIDLGDPTIGPDAAPATAARMVPIDLGDPEIGPDSSPEPLRPPASPELSSSPAGAGAGDVMRRALAQMAGGDGPTGPAAELGDPRGVPQPVDIDQPLPSMADRLSLESRLREAGDPYPDESAAIGGVYREPGAPGSFEKPPGDDGEMRGAQSIDAIRSLLGALDTGVRSYTGRGARPQRAGEADQLRASRTADEERKEGRADQAQAAQQRATGQDADREMAERRMSLLEQTASNRQSNAERSATRMEGLAESLGERREALTAGQAPRMEAQRAETERELALNDPESDLSASERQRVRGELESMPERAQAQVQTLLGNTNFDSLSGQQAQQLIDDVGRNLGTFRAATHRRGGAGGGGRRGGGDSQAEAQAAFESAGMTPEMAALAARDPRLRRSLLGRTGSAQVGEQLRQGRMESEQTELVPGVHAGVHVGGPEVRAFRTRYSQSGRFLRGLRRLGAIQRRYGAASAVSPEARGRINAELTMMQGEIAALSNRGTINGGDAEIIDAAIANPSDNTQAVLSLFASKSDQWRRVIEGQIEAEMDTLGVPQQERATALGTLRGRSAGGGDRVRMRFPPTAEHPNGRVGRVRRNRVDHYRAQGATEAD